ncbi:MAG TPA: hypothetical protein VHN18_01910, partial [Micromonosporaceae bacterium]|nr:hypothetical protein [Micromonosporaceae bacterium]
ASVAVPPPAEAVTTPAERRERVSGSVPPPVPGVPARTDGIDKRKWAALALVALLALGFVLAVALLDRNPSADPESRTGGNGQTQTSGPDGQETSSAPQPTSSAPQATASGNPPPANPPAQSPSAGQGQTGQPGGPGAGSAALPPGWTLHTDQTGFKVPVPQGWTESRRTYPWGPQVYFNGPGDRRIKIDQTSTHVQPDALADSQAHEANKRATVVNYQRVGQIHRVDYFHDAADWDWLETINGVRMHVRNRNFITSPGKQAYAIEFRLPVTEWNRVGDAQFKTIADGFVPRS